MKILNLTYNELVKQFKKPSIKIMFALILISAMVLPFGISKIPKDPYFKNNLETYKYMLEQSEQDVDNFKNDKTKKGKIQYEYAVIKRDSDKLIVDNKLGYNSWKHKAIENYESARYELSAINFVLAGYDQNLVMDNLKGVDPEEAIKYYNISLDKKKEIQSKYLKEVEYLKNIIDTDDYIAHTKEEIKESEYYISKNETTIKEYEKLKLKNPKDKEGKAQLEKLEKESKDSKNRIVQLNEDIEILNLRIKNKIDYNLENWKNNSILTIQKELYEVRTPLLTEKEYSNQAALEGYTMSYDEYVNNYKKLRVEKINNIKQIWFGLENNIPDLNDVTDARAVLNDTYEIYIILAIVMVIVIGGGIVSSEFSSGTIRLLLIRPVARWKILLSKFVAVLIVGFSIVVLGIGILYVSTGVAFDFETYKTPLLLVVNNEIVKQSFMSFLLSKVAMSCASLVFISSLVFMISTLSKNTALSVAISMLLYLGSAPISSFLVASGETWIVNTPIPYINSSYFRLVPTVSEYLSQLHGIGMQFESGATQLLIISIIMIVITFITFIKKDVKN